MANQSIKAAFERLWQHTVLAIDKATVKVDTTLSQEGKAADAKVVGEAFSAITQMTATDDGNGIITLSYSPLTPASEEVF